MGVGYIQVLQGKFMFTNFFNWFMKQFVVTEEVRRHYKGPEGSTANYVNFPEHNQYPFTEHHWGEVSVQRPKDAKKSNTHPSLGLFTLLPTGKKYRSIRCRTTRLQSSLVWEPWTHPPQPIVNNILLLWLFFQLKYKNIFKYIFCCTIMFCKMIH